MTMFHNGPIERWWERITDTFGTDRGTSYQWKGHEGIDFAIPEGTPIYACHGGRIRVSEFQSSGYGEVVVVENTELETTYAHCASRLCDVGDVVASGQQIAFSGNTGMSTGPHLHFGLRVKPWYRDPDWNGYQDPQFALMSLLVRMYAEAIQSGN